MMQKANKIQKNPGTKKQTAKRLRKYMPLYLLSLPGFIYLIINNYLPMGGLVLAFKKYSFAKGIVDSPWNGLQNFTFLFGSKWAKIMFRNTICYNLAFLILGTAFAIFVAILLSVIGRKLVKQAYPDKM